MLTFTPPPNWPPAPPGFVPPPGWRPDPSWPPAPPGWQFWQQQKRRWALDRAVAESANAGWTLRLGWLPVLALIAVLLVEAAVGAVTTIHVHGASRYAAFALLSVLHYAAAVAVIVAMGVPVARRAGGWARAFGWGPWRPIDLAIGLGGAAAEYVGRIVVAVVLVIAVPALRGHTESNISLSGRPTAEIVLLLILAVCVAPPIEELIFRGVLLRSLMQRYGFWPAALVSTTVFAALHLYEVHSIASMVLLFASIFVFGLGQCLLVRWTARLGTSITAHAISNGVAALLTLAAHR